MTNTLTQSGMAEQAEPSTKKSGLLVVLGMHRSGTSALTRGLMALGADLGPDLMPGVAEDNEKGFWEDLAVFHANEALLDVFGASWDSWRELDIYEQSVSLPDELSQRLHELLIERTAENSLYAFKDPRTSLMMPFWQPVFDRLGMEPTYVLSMRHPLCVAESLRRRNAFSLEKSLILWLRYTCRAYLAVKHKKHVLVDYDELLESPREQLARIQRIAGLAVDKSANQELDDYCESFLTTNLRHHSSHNPKRMSPLLDIAVQFYYALTLMATETSDNMQENLLAQCQNILSLLSSEQAVLAELDELEKQIAQVNDSMINTDEQQEPRPLSGKAIFKELARLHAEYYDRQVELALNIERQSAGSNYQAVSERLETATSRVRSAEIDAEHLRQKYDHLKQEHLTTVQDYAYYRKTSAEQLRQIYQKLVTFDRSLVGKGFKCFERGYAYLRLKPGSLSLYRQVLKQAYQELDTPEKAKADQQIQTSRLRLTVNVGLYALKHPFSCLRLFSVERFSKLCKTLLRGDKHFANDWVRERFPVSEQQRKMVVTELDESLDSIHVDFPRSDSPQVSIIVPVFNQYRMTISCLKAILENTATGNYEVLIADDCSSDATTEIENQVSNITIIRASENQGFLKNCNNAARQAKGEFVILLNNDTNVQPGWLEAMLKQFELNPQAGLVGPKLLFEDGRLQEAGGIVWQDASGWNFGRGQDASLPEFNYVRETDYISGACIMLRKTVWDQLGGFDEAFAPAYYEDTDLAFRIRELGLKVIYQPAAEVIHFEGVSNGTDLAGGVKKHQLLNQKVFKKRWQQTLLDQHYPNAESVFLARERAGDKKTVVVIDHYVPFYDKDAGSRSTWLYLQAMVEQGLNVKFLPANFFPHEPYTSELQQLGVEVLVGESYARHWKQWFSDNQQHIDVIYLHRPHITEDFIDFLSSLKNRPKLIYFGHDLHYLRIGRQAQLNHDKKVEKEASEWKDREFEIFQKVDKVFYPSQTEVDEIKAEMPDIDVSAIPLYLINKPAPGQYQHEHRDDLLFVGGFAHPPNIDAVRWFVKQVLPKVLEQIPTLRFHIVGSKVPESIKELESDNVLVHGFLTEDELIALYGKVKMSVVPLRYGAGVKGKILEALQAGIPIVTTPIGGEGIPEAENVMVISETPETMSEHIVTLYQDEAYCQHFLQHYPNYIDRYFSRKAVADVIKTHFLN